MSDAKKAGEPAQAPAAKGGSKLLPVFVGVNSLLLIGVMVFMVLQMKQQQQAVSAAIAALGKGPVGDKHDKAAPDEHAAPATEGHDEPPAEEPKGEPEEPGAPPPSRAVVVKLAEFVVHLRNPDADRYARMSFDVEVFADSDKDRINRSLPRVRDAFISYLSDRTLEDLRGSEGLARTKDSLQTTLRQVCPDARVRALYISDFVVQ